MKITCIDFETANPYYGSVCSLGIAVVEDNKITYTKNQLVKPHPKYSVFNRDNVRIHGITAEAVSDSPEFDAVYEEIRPLIENSFIAAHNTDFEVAVLKELFTVYNIPIPAFQYICTCEISQSIWKEAKSHRLKYISEYLNYEFKHHDAGADAAACANIIIVAMEKTGTSDIPQLAEASGVTIGKVKQGEPHMLKAGLAEKSWHNEHVSAKDIKASTGVFELQHPFYNKEVVFTGEFSNGLSRKKAMQKVVDSGGRVSDHIKKSTDVLAVGTKSYYRRLDGRESRKVKEAKKLIEAGSELVIMDEEQFIKSAEYSV